MVPPLWKDSLAFSYKTNIPLPFDAAIKAFLFILVSWRLIPIKNLHKGVYKSFIHNC